MTIEHTIIAHHPHGEYPLIIGKSLLKDPTLIHQFIKGKQVMIVSCDSVAPHYLDLIESACTEFETQHFILPDGEHNKSLPQLEKIWNALAENRYHRDATLIALGGGVVGDITGFAAACYHRGIPFIQIPTTLLAQTDASIGGKTAIDHPCGKNLIGAFHQPSAVIIDIDTLSTLPTREFRAGLAEIIKHALIKDSDFFNWLNDHIDSIVKKDPETLIEMLTRSCQIKCDIVAADEKEKTGTRALLNLGHTFGHAVEHNLNFSEWSHGEAVALGILMAAELSVRKGWLTEADRDRIKALFDILEMPNKLPSKVKPAALLSTLWNDKKVLNNQLHLVVLKGIGHAELTIDVDEAELLSLLTHYQ